MPSFLSQSTICGIDIAYQLDACVQLSSSQAAGIGLHIRRVFLSPLLAEERAERVPTLEAIKRQPKDIY